MAWFTGQKSFRTNIFIYILHILKPHTCISKTISISYTMFPIVSPLKEESTIRDYTLVQLRIDKYSNFWNTYLSKGFAHGCQLNIYKKICTMNEIMKPLQHLLLSGVNVVVWYLDIWPTSVISASHLYRCLFEFRSGEVYSIQHYVIKFDSELRQVGGFL
jgi:hypothetical protein